MQISITNLLCLKLLLHFSFALRLEISLHDKSGLKTRAKVVCEPTGKNFHSDKEQKIWWAGSKLGINERNMLRQRIPDDTFVPDIQVNSTSRYRCFLMSPKPSIDKDRLKKRIHREITGCIRKDGRSCINILASIPADSGSCKPGYRLDQDSCYACPAGTYGTGESTNCTMCPLDFYVDKEASDSCLPCPEDKKTMAVGADTEELCVYVDTSGRPISTTSTKLMVIGICAALFILVAWIVIGIYLWWWYREKKAKAAGEKSSAEDHIYAEIEDVYETPKKISKDRVYLDLIPSDEGYEKPIKASKDRVYSKIIEDYEVPIKPKSKENLYTEIIPSEHFYETIKDSEEANIYEEIKETTSGSRSRERRPSTSGEKPEGYGIPKFSSRSRESRPSISRLKSEEDHEKPRYHGVVGERRPSTSREVPEDYEIPKFVGIEEERRPSTSREKPEDEYEVQRYNDRDEENTPYTSRERPEDYEIPKYVGRNGERRSSARRKTQEDDTDAPRPTTSESKGHSVEEDRYETHQATSSKDRHESLSKKESSGFTLMWLEEEEEKRLKPKKDDYDQLAKIILKTSKSETDTFGSNGVPDLEKLGYDVKKLSQLIQDLSERADKDKTSKELIDASSRQKMTDRRHLSAFATPAAKEFVPKKVISESQKRPRHEVKDSRPYRLEKGGPPKVKSSKRARKSEGRVRSTQEAKGSSSSSQASRSASNPRGTSESGRSDDNQSVN
ncbi:ephrin_rec_like domain-containing protein [Caerostris darwini]|uniref:Ephrin_rec_like domain-containing protein n=1 Tax=Caerostris darwini TaxID=1538125 RepID=A0AAV4WZN6_9ARAC|nr:ephrin_rec_like domain-containing protein [Caerostris darwini]